MMLLLVAVLVHGFGGEIEVLVFILVAVMTLLVLH